MSLKSILRLAAALLGGLAVATLVSLALTTTHFRRLTVRAGDVVESVRLAQEVEVELLQYDRSRDRVASGQGGALIDRARTERRIHEYLASLRGLAEDRAELAQIDRITTALSDYFAARTGTEEATRADTTSFVDVAPIVDMLERLVDLNVAQAAAARDEAARLQRVAQLIGGVVAVLLVASAASLSWSVRASIAPLIDVARAMERFGRGDRQARAPERGASELKEIARTYNEMAEALAREQQNQLTFVAGVAHDLRNPLSALKMGLMLDREDLTRADMRRIWTITQRQVNVLERMIGDLLDATRIQGGQLQLQRTTCDLGTLAQDVADLYGSLESHRVAVTLSPEPVLVDGDPARLAQVLNNLVSNAVKYSPAGTTVRIEVAADRGTARVSVTDQGIGISAEESERIFEPFRRSPSTRDSVPGVGLGLSVARKIVRAHGGDLVVQSRPGHGSRFTLTLPGLGTPAPRPDVTIHREQPGPHPANADVERAHTGNDPRHR
jgi:signal transduction histidine kinase